jgi:TPR repeat protein
MANSLRGYGFTVIERSNLTTRQVGQTLREFRSKLTPGSVAVVFYAGHGVQIKGENYLPTVDAEINGEEDVPMQSLSTRQIMDVLSESKTQMNLVFLDACRDNPYARSFRSGSRGIAKENAPSGTLISFATRPGSVAADGDGRNGLYTSVLLEQIKQSNQPIEQVLKRVVSGVKIASKGQQEPWMEGSIEGDFCFGSCLNREFDNSQLEIESWRSAVRLNSIESYQIYLKGYPQGRYADLATIAILKIRNEVPMSKVDAQNTSVTPNKPNESGNVPIDAKKVEKENWKSTYKQPAEIKDGYPSGNKIHMVGGSNTGKPYLGFILNIKPREEDLLILNGKYQEAMQIFQQLDKEGDPSAAHNIGMMLYRGLGVEKDVNKAMIYFEKSMKDLSNYATSSNFYDRAKKESLNTAASKKATQDEKLYLDKCTVNIKNNCIYEFQFSTGAKIVGVKVDGKLNGQLIYTHPRGIVYIGDSDGTMNGKGVRINPDGSRYSGWWAKDQRQGEGIEYSGNGTFLRSGYWENDKLIRSYKLESVDFPFLPKSKIASIAFEADNKTLKSVQINQR